MAFMPDQIGRLLRTQWKDAQTLAEEMFAIFSSDEPLKITSPVELGPTDGVPPLTINTNQYIDNNGDIQDVPPIITKGPNGGLVPNVPLPPGSEPFVPDGETPTGGGNAFVGEVLSGSGATYTCNVSGPDGPLGSFSVTMPGLQSDAELPAGAYVTIIRVSGLFYGMPSVFYGPTS